MKVYLNSITGLDDAMVSMLMSKRSWSREKEVEIRKLVNQTTNIEGSTITCMSDVHSDFSDQMDKLIKYGVGQGHTTLLRFIDLSFTVEGLHRGGQDDWDAHTKRFDNRIVRASTRLGSFKEGEVSDYYKEKIKFPFEVLEQVFGGAVPSTFTDTDTGNVYVRTDYGYILDQYKDDQDVKRGLYPLSIPSNFIFKIQYPELCHVVQFRDIKSHANPEVQELAETIKVLVGNSNKWLGDNLTILKMEPK